MTTLLILAIPIIILYAWYVGLIGKRNKALEALSTIDVQLKQRFDLIPNILKIAQRFLEHEQGLMAEITALRSKVAEGYNSKNHDTVLEHISAVEELTSKMGQLMVTVENYPALKTDQTMMQAMQTYNEVEAQITAARRFYNAAVTALNNSIQIFPGNLVAKMAGVAEMPFFKADEAVHQSIDAAQYLK